ncbi:hypothetical protein [Bacillus pinisoli]|uniref:hypothetical protein n=1 Tax=Bacillus pinisoli TaxID=2901866 RepID=UPI001FF65C14|nr:hypothetical protein [Bacillus pinisoli]
MKIIKFIPVVGLTLALAACGTTTSDKQVEQATESQVVNGSSGTSNNNESKSVLLKEEAAYVGQADPHSIEVHTETETLTLQIGKGIDMNWSSLEKNTPVTIEYFKNELGQYELVSIDVPESSSKKLVTQKEEAAYVGQIDVNSIEVHTESETIALQVGGIKDVDWGSIEKGTPILIEYYKNEVGQYVLTSVKVNR